MAADMNTAVSLEEGVGGGLTVYQASRRGVQSGRQRREAQKQASPTVRE